MKLIEKTADVQLFNQVDCYGVDPNFPLRLNLILARSKTAGCLRDVLREVLRDNCLLDSVKDKPRVGMIDDKIINNTFMIGVSYFFSLFFTLLLTIYRVNESVAVLLFSCPSIIASLPIVFI